MAETLWTADDLAILKCAIMKKASGDRLLASDLGGKMEQWADAPLDELKETYAWMQSQINNAATPRGPRIARSLFSQGFK